MGANCKRKGERVSLEKKNSRKNLIPERESKAHHTVVIVYFSPGIILMPKISKATSKAEKYNHAQYHNNLSSHLERFVNYLQYTKNASERTIENYTLRINRFIEYIGDIEVDKIKMIHIQDFRTHLIKQ